MPRIRTISPTFPHAPAIGRLTREARLFFILLWTVADDSGRLRLNYGVLAEQLFPTDGDAPVLLPHWLGELEAERCVERYNAEDIEYLRIVNWRNLQTIHRPSRSRLPGPSHDSQESPANRPKRQMRQASEADLQESDFFGEEIDLPGTPGEFPPERVHALLEIALRKSLAADAQTATARYIELAGRTAGMWGGKGAPSGKKEPEQRSKSPAELMREEAAKHGRSGRP